VELTMNQPLTSIPLLLSQRAASNGNETIFRTKDRGIWKAVTWSELDARVRAIGSALLAADFARGDVAAVLSETRPEAVYADLAVLGSGAASIAVDPDEDPDRLCHLLSSSGARLAFVENEEQLDKVLTVRGRCPALARIVVFDMKGLRDFADPGCSSLASFIDTTTTTDWPTAIRSIEADQPAVILFPRDESMGRTLTHGDLVHLVNTARAQLPLRHNDERLVVLRLSDITERVWGLYLALETGCISNYPEGPDTVIENLQELKPTVLGANAAAWSHLQALAAARAKAATRTQRVICDWALRAGRLGGSAGRVADLFVLQAVRREFGLGKLRLAYVGGTPVAPTASDWARSLGIAIQRVDDSTAGSDQVDERYQALLQNAYA
jgi:long-chain acyl-CoA synthetase